MREKKWRATTFFENYRNLIHFIEMTTIFFFFFEAKRGKIRDFQHGKWHFNRVTDIMITFPPNKSVSANKLEQEIYVS